MQTAVWDFLKALDEAPLPRAANIAHLLAALLLRGAVPLSVLKVVEWARLSDAEAFFWQVCFVGLLGGSRTELAAALSPLGTHADKFAELRAGLQLFVARHMRPMVTRDHPTLLGALGALGAALGAAAAPPP